ncbi:A disintegrin and metalloproteinase with thrombospondin motifs 4 isoform X1 [Microcaecilia unicolor]|uniref:A disintegrin and metalloproteinase with thrombospondin motifs 4 n=1 Tax=Microcaecilia unicolor TaxID=1415580 RepID=A0A6P7WSL4_9AMPH|nr:A disintegrin and metalloproteinase with thrombospondin motifs 4 isoform X1 [Microcaecilia unicolor]
MRGLSTMPCLLCRVLLWLPLVLTSEASYREEIVFPERINSSFRPPGQEETDWSRNGLGSHSEARLLLRFRAFGEELLLDLEKDPSFLSEDLTVQYLGRNGQRDADGLVESGAYFTGTVNSDPESIAAVSYNGKSLLGVLQYQGTEFHIQQLEGGSPNSAEGVGAHLIRKKVPEKGSGPMCNVGAQWSAAAAGFPRTPQGAERNLPSRRAKRFASVPRYVETLVVADESMATFHGAGLKRYLLTVMAATSKFFRHPSLKNPVNVVVTRLVVIGRAEKGKTHGGLKVTSNAAEMLRNFCEWQKGLNKLNDSDSEHFDTAILFTRQDLCGVSTCDTLGMADVGTVCDPSRSCSIVEDDGLQSAFTTAHELGHVFNMLHDNAKPCLDLNQQASNTRHMMAPVMSYVDPEELWSPCSARFITDFLDNGHGHCLLDKPHAPLRLPVPFPGNDYDSDRQCQLTFGPDSRHCPNPQTPCSSLWCTGRIDGHFMCQTKHFPWADGTPCGVGKTCMNGRCISRVEMKAYNTPVNGGWGSWGAWGECSRTCGGGVQFSIRECNKPVPRNGGKYCEGKRTQYRSCNTKECPGSNALTFREQQCATYNHRTDLFKGFPSPMDWVPRYSGIAEKDQCKLTCQSKPLGYYYVLEPRVADGTPCSPDTTSVCVQGRCVHAGCDRIIGSKKKFDKCMACGGNGSTCTKTYGSFTQPRYGYNDVITIPAGATNILIRQNSGSTSSSDGIYLAVKRQDGSYALNGNYILVPSEVDINVGGGVSLRYSGATKAMETITGRGPLKVSLTIQALVVADKKAPRLKYTFFIPKSTTRPVPPRKPMEDWLKRRALMLEILKRSRSSHK